MTLPCSRSSLLLYLATLLIIYPAWACGGTKVELMAPLQFIALLTALAYLFYPNVDEAHRIIDAPSKRENLRANLKPVLRDPAFYFFGLFVGYLALAWINAGRIRLFDYATQTWIMSPPRIAWFPSAVNPVDAREMVYWFFPLWVLVVVLRHGLKSWKHNLLLWKLLVLNACILVVFGLVQKGLGVKAIYGIYPVLPDTFASFGYGNHTGDYFSLALACASALLLLTLTQRRKLFSNYNIWPLILVLTCFVGANGSASRAAMVLSVLIALILIMLVFKNHYAALPGMDKVYFASLVALLFITGVALVLAVGEKLFTTEFSDLVNAAVEEEIEVRLIYLTAGIAMLKDHWLLGVGPWGYSYYLADYVDKVDFSRGGGAANAHNDLLQFLVEFGSVGFTLVMGGGMCLVVSWFKAAWKYRKHNLARTGIQTLLILSLLMIVAHSTVDLPFRSPAILYFWITILVCLPRVGSMGSA